eukprot:223464-Pyramimonas_sp.AAC.1
MSENIGMIGLFVDIIFRLVPGKHVYCLGVRQVVWLPIPSGWMNFGYRIRPRLAEWNKRAAELAEAAGWLVVDIYHMSDARPEKMDGTHFGNDTDRSNIQVRYNFVTLWSGFDMQARHTFVTLWSGSARSSGPGARRVGENGSAYSMHAAGASGPLAHRSQPPAGCPLWKWGPCTSGEETPRHPPQVPSAHPSSVNPIGFIYDN